MKTRPIIFSGAMVKAIREGRKTQTRRLVRWPRAAHLHGREPLPERSFADNSFNGDLRSDYFHAAYTGGDLGEDVCSTRIDCPYGVVGDRLWVRETWYDDNALRKLEPAPAEPDEFIEYRASHDCRSWEAGCPCNDEQSRSAWRPSIYMPRWASRITLELTGVRAERLQDISEEDAESEGVTPLTPIGADQPILDSPRRRTHGTHPHVLAYAVLWDEINGDRAPWVSKPWVWVVEFRQLTAEECTA